MGVRNFPDTLFIDLPKANQGFHDGEGGPGVVEETFMKVVGRDRPFPAENQSFDVILMDFGPY